MNCVGGHAVPGAPPQPLASTPGPPHLEGQPLKPQEPPSGLISSQDGSLPVFFFLLKTGLSLNELSPPSQGQWLLIPLWLLGLGEG